MAITEQVPTIRSSSSTATNEKLGPFGKIVVIAFICFVIWGLTALIARGSVGNPYVGYPVSSYMQQLGFNVATPHPLQLGAPIVGSDGQISGSAQFFLFAGDGSIHGSSQPASSIRLGLSVGQKSFILEIPYNKVVFIQSTSQPSAATFTINDMGLDTLPQTAKWCLSLWNPICHTIPKVQPTARDTASWMQIEQNGLGQLLQQYIVSVQLTLSPQQYQTYLGS